MPTAPDDPLADLTRTERYEDGLPTLPGKPPLGSGLLPALLELYDHLPGITLEGEIGRGGAGVVFRGRRESDGQTVAVKMLRRADPDEPLELARFVAEAASAAAVSHPNVVRLYGFGEHKSRQYLVLEHCPGGSLAQRLRRDGPPSPADACRMLAQVADGLHAVHLAGIVHRDVKPGNVLFAADGTPKLADFGLAKRPAGSSDLTRSRAVLGSPAYMSPEQASGESKFVGPAADVWAVGVVLYECLTGRLPFAGPEPLAVLRAVTEDAPPPLRKLAPHAPRDLILVAELCLAKEPGDRYPSAAALAADLRAVVAGRPVAARGPGPVKRLTRLVLRHPVPSFLAVGLAASLATGAAVSTVLAVRYRSEQRQTAALLEQVRAERQATWDALDSLTDQTVERQIARQPELTPADRKFLAEILAQFERATSRYEDGAGSRRMVAHGRFRVALMRHRLGEVTEALAGYQAAVAGFRSALSLEPDSANGRNGLANSLERMGGLLADLGRPDEGLEAGREAVAIRQALGDRTRLGEVRGAFALTLFRAGRRTEAVAEYRVALADLLAVGESTRSSVAQVRINLGMALALDPTDWPAAEAEYRAAADEYEALLAADPTAPRERLALVRARCNLGRLYVTQGRVAEAADRAAAAVGLARELVRELPGYSDHVHELARALTLLATAERAGGRTAAALRLVDEAVGFHRRAVAARPQVTYYRRAYAENRRVLAEAALDLGDHAAAAAAAGEYLAASQTPDRGVIAGGLLARAAALARWDWRLSPAERAAAAAGYRAKAKG